MRPSAAAWAPWSRRTLILSVAAMALGVVLLVAAWIGASRESQLSQQVALVNLAVVGSAIAATGQAICLLCGRRSVGVLRRQVLPDREHPRRPAASRVAHVSTSVVALSSSKRYHRPDCLLVGGKEAIAVDPSLDGMRPCEVCRP